MLHIDKVVSLSRKHNLSDVKLTLYSLSVSDGFYKREEKKIFTRIDTFIGPTTQP